MNLLVNNHDCSIDAKNRLMIPAEFRREVEKAAGSPRWYVVLHVNNRLVLMPEDHFDQWVNSLPHSPLPGDEEIEFRRSLFRRVQRMEPDKQGRVVLPERLLNRAGLGREVTLVGQGDQAEIYDRNRLQAEDGDDRFDELYRKRSQAANAPGGT